MNTDQALARIEEMAKAAKVPHGHSAIHCPPCNGRCLRPALPLALLVVQLGQARQAQRAWEEFFDQTHWGRRTGTAFNRKYQELKEAWCELQEAADNALLAFAETLGETVRADEKMEIEDYGKD